MSSTNKTTNLQLSQFVGTDKPTWLTDYNGDMQKIDSGFQEIKEANATTQEELEGIKESMGLSGDEVQGIKEEIQQLKDNDNSTNEKLITLGQNYETMHHELVLNNAAISEHNEEISELKEDADGLLSIVARSIYLDTLSGSDDNDGLSTNTPVKTFKRAQEIMIQRQSLSRMRIKAGTTVVIDSGIYLTTMVNFDKYGDGEKPVIQLTTGVNINTMAFFIFNNLTFEYVGNKTDDYINFYAGDLTFNDCKFIGENFNIALYAAAKFARATFDINTLNSIGGLLIIRDTTGGTINKIGGYGSIINIDEASVTVGSYVGTHIKNVLQ